MKSLKIGANREFDTMIVKMREWDRDEKTTKRDGRIEYINAACAFDVETTTFEVPTYKEKKNGTTEIIHQYLSTVYSWVFNFEGYKIRGRTTEDFVNMLYTISNRLQLNTHRRLVIYVHNLSYEFQFLYKWCNWDSVFARRVRHPIKAVTDFGIEFRCSYVLSGYALGKLARTLNIQTVEKDQYDYRIVRHLGTHLTDAEWQYVEHDTQIVVDYIRSEIKRNEGCISRIPLTRTSYIRRRLQEMMYAEGYQRASSNLISGLTLSINEYIFLKEAFAGGFTHANVLHCGELQHDMYSLDESSAYPAMMASKYYPMSKGVYMQFSSLTEMEEAMRSKCVVIKLTFHGLRSQDTADFWLSSHKVLCPPKDQSRIVYNGRVVSADLVTITITEVDWKTFKQYYIWDRMDIGGAYVYERGYLPLPIIRLVGELYTDKTSLKDVPGQEYQYTHSKEDFNSIYGCMVTDILPDVIEFDHGWKGRRPLTESEQVDELSKYNRKYQRSLFYPWGVYITAWARQAIFFGILEFGMDYHYSDTDSLKVEHLDEHMIWVDTYNATIDRQIKKICNFYDLSDDMFHPKDPDGNVHHLGHFEIEGEIKDFKTLRAKCYAQLFRKIGGKKWKFNCTISGVNKEKGSEYLNSLGGVDALCDHLVFPEEVSGKLTAVYNDDAFTYVLTDRDGVMSEVSERSCVALVQTEYHLNSKEDIFDFADRSYLAEFYPDDFDYSLDLEPDL